SIVLPRKREAWRRPPRAPAQGAIGCAALLESAPPGDDCSGLLSANDMGANASAPAHRSAPRKRTTEPSAKDFAKTTLAEKSPPKLTQLTEGAREIATAEKG